MLKQLHEVMKKRKIIHKEYQKFINKYNWKGINYPSGKGEWRMFEKSNLTIALKVLNAKKKWIYKSSLHFKTQLKSFF